METKLIGGPKGLKASIVGVGCNARWLCIDETTTHAVIDAAIDAGMNFLIPRKPTAAGCRRNISGVE